MKFVMSTQKASPTNIMTDLIMQPTTKSDTAAAALFIGMSKDEIADRLAVMQHQESTTWYRRVDYLSNTSNIQVQQQQHIQWRSKMCTWCHQVVDTDEQLSRLAVTRSMNYLDRFLASSSSHCERARDALANTKEYQLVAMTSLYIAIKIHEPLVSLGASLLAEISEFDTKDILDMERCILEALDWRMNDPTSQDFVRLLLGMLNPEQGCYGHDHDYLDTVLVSLLEESTFQCELATTDYDLSTCKPSTVALASILNSINGMYEELLPNEAQYALLARVCDMMSPSMDMDEVGFVQTRLQKKTGVHLRRRRRQSPGIDLQLWGVTPR